MSEAMGFTPFKMVFEHEVRGPLKLLKEQLFQSERDTVLQYVSEFKDRFRAVCQVARTV